jgi:cytochrome c oxidase subunit 4
MSRISLRGCIFTWLALLILLALSTASALLPLGGFNLIANLGIAGVKALVVALVFMRLAHSDVTVRIAAVAGFAWLAILIVLSLADFTMRG